MDTPTPPQARVSRITAARLHNLGNYEHVRYEVSVEVPEGASASLVFSNLERVLAGLDPTPPVAAHDLRRAAAALQKPVEEWPEWERDNVEAYRQCLAKDAAWRAEQKLAREALDSIGGTSVFTDAKEQWDEEN